METVGEDFLLIRRGDENHLVEIGASLTEIGSEGGGRKGVNEGRRERWSGERKG